MGPSEQARQSADQRLLSVEVDSERHLFFFMPPFPFFFFPMLSRCPLLSPPAKTLDIAENWRQD